MSKVVGNIAVLFIIIAALALLLLPEYKSALGILIVVVFVLWRVRIEW